MSTKPIPSDLPIHSFPTASDFEAFLDLNHSTSPGIYLKLAKKASGLPSITGGEAVEVALCYGWIDSRANGFDDDWFLARYTPRRAKTSIWSKKNVDTVGRLIEEGRMRPAGLAAVEAAKTDGRWERAYPGPATIEVPEDLRGALAREKKAERFFAGLNRSDRYAVLWRVQVASPARRRDRIEKIVEMLGEGKCPGRTEKVVVGKGEKKNSAGVVKKKAAKVKKQRVVVEEELLSTHVQSASPVLNSVLARPSRRSGLRRRP